MRATSRSIVAGVLCALAACKVHAHLGQLSAGVEVDVDGASGGWAAMDEVPACGGELRLVTPVPAEPDVLDGRYAIGFPLRHTDVHARVAGIMSVTTVEQVFDNPYDHPIDAVYVFPLDADAAVSGYQIVIGDRTIAGEIQQRDQARRTYEHARSRGYTTALVEQDQPNVFSQRVANIAPHETVRVRLEYTALLDYADGHYDLVVPLVVGPRYLPAGAHGDRAIASHREGGPRRLDATSIPYAPATRAGGTVSFTADIDAGVPVTGVVSPSHSIDVVDVAPTRTRVTLHRADELPNRDLIVRFGVAGPRTTVGVVAHRAGGDGYFALEIQPKATYRPGDVTPREAVILIDTSGSMDGGPLGQAKAIADRIIDGLADRDSFDVMAFASGVDAMADLPVAGDLAGRARGHAFVASLQAGGGTELGRGMLASLTTDPGADRIRAVYLITDGFIGNDDQILNAARGALGANRIFTVGVGSAPNRSLLDRLARLGRGFATYVTPAEDPADAAGPLVARSGDPYLTDVSIDWGGLAVTDLTPQVIPDVFAGQPLIVSGRFERPGAGTVRVRATSAGRRVEIPVAVTLPDHNDLPPVAALWARRRIDALLAESPGDVTRDVERAVTDLGLRFHLVTRFTSFVAVDRTRVVAPGGAVQVVEQPALAPAGVNLDMAVGPDPDPAPVASSSGGGGHHSWGGGGGGGGDFWGGGGDADPITILLALALIPLAWQLRRLRDA